MLLDRSGSMKPNYDLEERSAEAFVGAMGPADKARIGSFATRIQVDPDEFTSEHGALLKILRGDLQEDGPTPLWNAVDTGIDKLLVEQGRRVVLVFTDGVDMPLNFSNGNKSLKDVMKRAEENDIMVYAIGLAGENGSTCRSSRHPDPAGRSGGGGGLGGRSAGGSGGGGLQWKAGLRAAEDRRCDRRQLLELTSAGSSRRRSRASPTSSIINAPQASPRKS